MELIEPQLSESTQALFNVIIPQQGFSLSRHSQSDKDKIKDEILDKIRTCENSLNKFYGEYNEYADAWRVQRTRNYGNNPKSLFNSRTGETHRAVEALCTFWYRVLTANDPYFEAVGEGLSPNGQPLTPEQLYAIEQIILKQNNFINFRKKLLLSLRSAGTFGTAIVEEPFIQRPVSGSRRYMEATDFVLSPLIKSFFDTNLPDITLSDFMANADYATANRIISLAYNDTESWDLDAVKKALDGNSSDSVKRDTSALDRINQRKVRAGYQDVDKKLHELINYHGRLSKDCIETGLIQEMWQFEGDDQDPATVDFSFRLLDSGTMVSAYPTQYGDWRTRFKTFSIKQFELEPIGYGIGRVGRKAQGEMDFITSNANNLSTLSTYGMWLVSKYAGIKSGQLGMEPNNLIEVEDITNALTPLRPDVNAISYAINLLASLKADFRSTTGATDTLQAALTKASATESSIAQNEAVRQQSVTAEIIGEAIREHFETQHLNNINHLDTPIWIALGEENPELVQYTKANIPINVGFKMKMTTDKDYRPQRLDNLFKAIQLYSSIRQDIDPTIGYNASKNLSKEAFRSLSLDPRKLFEQVPMKDQLAMQMRRNQINNSGGGQGGAIGNELSGEMMGEMGGGGVNIESSPVGDVEMSPNNPNLIDGSA